MSGGCSKREVGGGPLLPPPLGSSLGAMLLGEGSPSGLDASSSMNTNMESPTSETAVHIGRSHRWVWRPFQSNQDDSKLKMNTGVGWGEEGQ